MTFVRVGGAGLSGRGIVREVVDSTIFRRDGLCGCLQSTITWGVDPDFMAPWLKRGASVQVIEGAGVTWNGFVSQTERLEDGLSIVADGLLVHAMGRPAVENIADPGDPPIYVPTGDANVAVDTHIADFGLPWDRHGNDLGSVPLEPGKWLMLNDLLVQCAQTQGKYCEVGMSGEVRMIEEPTDVTWMTSPMDWFTSENDDQFLSALFGFYDDGTLKQFEPALDDDGIDQFGFAADVADLLARGVMTKLEAQTEVSARLLLVRGRMGWGGQIELTPLNLWRVGASHASAMSPRAGERITKRGGYNNRASTAVMAGTTVTLGKVERRHSDQTASAYPLGMAPRDFAAATAAVPAPGSDVAGAA